MEFWILEALEIDSELKESLTPDLPEKGPPADPLMPFFWTTAIEVPFHPSTPLNAEISREEEVTPVGEVPAVCDSASLHLRY